MLPEEVKVNWGSYQKAQTTAEPDASGPSTSSSAESSLSVQLSSRSAGTTSFVGKESESGV